MDPQEIFWIAILVFILMVTGLFLTLYEFLKISEDPSIKKNLAEPGRDSVKS